MNGDVRPSVNKILNAIEQGNLTTNETIRRVEAIIQAEAGKPDAEIDLELISACENLLEELNLHQAAEWDDRLAANRRQVAERIRRVNLRRKAFRIGVRSAAVAAALMVLLVAVDMIFHRGWFVEYSTEDEQQYVVQGEVTEPNLVEAGTAMSDETNSEITTTSYEELISFLGYEPVLPAWLPETLQLTHYWASKDFGDDFITVRYVDLISEQTIQYMQVCYKEIEDARVLFEQNAQGEILTIDSITVYRTENMDKSRYNWLVDNNVFSLSGALANEDAFKIIQSTLLEESIYVQKNE